MVTEIAEVEEDMHWQLADDTDTVNAVPADDTADTVPADASVDARPTSVHKVSVELVYALMYRNDVHTSSRA